MTKSVIFLCIAFIILLTGISSSCKKKRYFKRLNGSTYEHVSEERIIYLEDGTVKEYTNQFQKLNFIFPEDVELNEPNFIIEYKTTEQFASQDNSLLNRIVNNLNQQNSEDYTLDSGRIELRGSHWTGAGVPRIGLAGIGITQPLYYSFEEQKNNVVFTFRGGSDKDMDSLVEIYRMVKK